MRRIAKTLLSLLGWHAEMVRPPGPKCVIIFYPHTSNWDFLFGYLAKVAGDIPAQWMGKDTLFRWPLGPVLRRMGGVPVNRRAPTGVVRQLVRELGQAPRMWLAIAPEGTRSHTEYWKSGFYRLALEAKVPVGLASIDYRTRTVRLATYITLTGDTEKDLERIRAVYAGKVGKRPEKAGTIRLRHETPVERRD